LFLCAQQLIVARLTPDNRAASSSPTLLIFETRLKQSQLGKVKRHVRCTAWATLERNNALAVFDLDAETAVRIVPLGYKDNQRSGNGLDASDEDGKINIRTWPIRSWYEPDFIAAMQLAGGTYLVTANEGDPRDFGPGNYSEVKRVAELTLDPTSFPNAAFLQRPENLGRLQVSAVDGDTNGDGRYEQLYAFGGRSFGIWTGDGKLVFDSGSQFERIIAAAIPQFFNAPDDANTFDRRSDSRGPEPEPLDVGTIDARQYAFIGFERIGGVMVYDITHPSHPHARSGFGGDLRCSRCRR
jgi:Choice-of-anchor I domain